MPDLRDRFATLDRMPMPDLWSDVERRAAALGSAERPTRVTVGMPGRAAHHGRRTGALLAAAALLVALSLGAIAVGSGLVRLPAIVPAPVASPSPDPASPSPSDTAEPSAVVPGEQTAWVVYHSRAMSGSFARRSQVWAMRSDGSGAHEIWGGSDSALAWSSDGSRLLLDDSREGAILLAQVDDEIGQFVDTGIRVPRDGQWEGFDFAPDGERVVFVQRSKCADGASPAGFAPAGVDVAAIVAETAGADCWVLVVLDLRTGDRTRLGDTLVKDQTRNQNLALELPAWSPDGTKIAYTRLEQATDQRELWVVDADGSHPTRIGLDGDVGPREPRWSPDGTRIAFTSVTFVGDGPGESTVYIADVATGRSERIVIDAAPAASVVCCAEWIDGTHLRVQDQTADETYRFWSVALEAVPRVSRILVDLSDAMPAAGDPGRPTMRSAPGDPGRTFYWQRRPIER